MRIAHKTIIAKYLSGLLYVKLSASAHTIFRLLLEARTIISVVFTREIGLLENTVGQAKYVTVI